MPDRVGRGKRKPRALGRLQPGQPARAGRQSGAAAHRIQFCVPEPAELVCRTTSVVVTLSLAKRLGVEGYGRIEFAFNIVFWLVLLLRDSSDVIVARELSRHPRLIRPLVDQVLAYKSLFALVLFSALTLVGSLTLADRSDWMVLALYGLMLFTTAIGLDFVFRGTERMGLVALRSAFAPASMRSGSWPVRARCQPDRLGAGLADRGRGERDRAGLVQLFEELPAAAAAAGFAVSLDHRAARAECLPDPAFAGGDQLGRPAGGRVLELLERRRPLRGAAPDGHGPADIWPDFSAGGVPDPGAVVAADGGAGREALDSLVEVLMTGLVPVAVGCTVLADPLVHLCSPPDYAGAGSPAGPGDLAGPC